MADFEYLRSIGIGYYYPGSSFFHQRDARIKILFFSILILAAAVTTSLTGLILGFLFICLGFWLARVSLIPSLRTIRSVVPFLFFLIILQAVFFKPDENSILLWQWKFMKIYSDTLFSAVILLIRFLALILLLGLMTSVLSTLEMNHGLELLMRPLEKIGIRTEGFVMVIQIMLRFLPLLALRMEEIAKSQAARGAGWDEARGGIFKSIRLILPLIIPLFLNTLQRSERVADAMLCRGYGMNAARTHYYEYHIDYRDILFLAAGLGIAALVLFLPSS